MISLIGVMIELSGSSSIIDLLMSTIIEVLGVSGIFLILER